MLSPAKKCLPAALMTCVTIANAIAANAIAEVPPLWPEGVPNARPGWKRNAWPVAAGPASRSPSTTALKPDYCLEMPGADTGL
jgi:hypothetical protein